MTLDEARKELADYAADEFPGIWDQCHLQQCIRVVLAALPTWEQVDPSKNVLTSCGCLWHLVNVHVGSACHDHRTHQPMYRKHTEG